MDIILSIILTCVGITVLVIGGNFLINGSVGISKRLGISSFIIGMTVLAYGTSAPELATSISAISLSHPEIILGNIAGSNIANVGLVSAVALIMGSGFMIVWRKHVIEFVIVLISSVLLIILLLDGNLSLLDGGLLLIMLVSSAFILIHINSKNNTKVENNNDNDIIQTNDTKISPLPKSIAFVLLGGIMLWIGSTLTIDNATTIGTYIGLSDHVIGITIIAIGTSLPELVTTIIAIRKKELGLFFGNIIGSNIANILLIGGVSAVVSGGLVINNLLFDVVLFDVILACLFTIIFIVSQIFGKAPRIIGIILLISYIVWIVSSLKL